MAIGINKVILLGFVGQKPEHSELSSGYAATSFSLATSKSWKDKADQICKDTQWHHIICYGQAVEQVCQYLKKGSLCYVEGELKNSQWEAPEGLKRQKTQIILHKFRCLDYQKDISDQNSIPRIKNINLDNKILDSYPL